MESTVFVLPLVLPKQVVFQLENKQQELQRAQFLEFLWTLFGERGLCGIHEGTVLSEEAHEHGLETESWTIDSAEAPKERDWVSALSLEKIDLYFEGEMAAQLAYQVLSKGILSQGGAVIHPPYLLEQRDWDAEWKASFKGIEVPPFWKIEPPWYNDAHSELNSTKSVVLKVNPGAGFGTGTHETTQLCLRQIGEIQKPIQSVLDFGSGSGILAIAAAKAFLTLQSKILAVEIDELAIENAKENASLNEVIDCIEFQTQLEDYSRFPSQSFSLVIANILRPVLIQYSKELVSRLELSGSYLLLSGLIDRDVPEVLSVFNAQLDLRNLKRSCKVTELGEWRSILWSIE